MRLATVKRAGMVMLQQDHHRHCQPGVVTVAEVEPVRGWLNRL